MAGFWLAYGWQAYGWLMAHWHLAGWLIAGLWQAGLWLEQFSRHFILKALNNFPQSSYISEEFSKWWLPYMLGFSNVQLIIGQMYGKYTDLVHI